MEVSGEDADKERKRILNEYVLFRSDWEQWLREEVDKAEKKGKKAVWNDYGDNLYVIKNRLIRREYMKGYENGLRGVIRSRKYE